ncbi:MAG: hypothetical protein IKD09_00460, partial [Lentisphaeria bacterium]|nr:hypothetical protein [Lentisphaeria bacterium]
MIEITAKMRAGGEIGRPLSPEIITDSHRLFLEKSSVECYYIGSDDASPAVELIKDAFSKTARNGGEINTYEAAFVSPRRTENLVCEELGSVSQGRLNIGCTCGTVMSSEGYHAMS